MKKALICGISGQDGAYLAKFLLSKNYEVYGTSRDAQTNTFSKLQALGIADDIHFESMSLNDFRSVLQVLTKVSPVEIYNLAGQSSVSLSFEQPVETMDSIGIGTLNLIEAIRFTGKEIRFYNACSSECFGDTGDIAADENTPFRPRSPYAAAKAAAYWEVANYREAYNLFCCSGILFNHESPLRPDRFVTKKIVMGAKNIALGVKKNLHLGNLKIKRDWGWAPEYVEAMWKMLQLESPEDFVIATGTTHSLEDFVATAFEQYDLDWKKYVEIEETLKRPTDLSTSKANPGKARKILDWKAEYNMPEIVKMMSK